MSVRPHITKVVNLWKVQDMLTTGIIKLDAAYQRDIVWQTSKMSMLIDSLMKKYYIPPLLFAVRTDENGENVRVCIDGKQRLTSILRFTQNKIPYLDEISGVVEEIYFEPPSRNDSHTGQKEEMDRKYLSEEERENFNETEVVMIEFSELDEDQELEIFARVQMGVSITAAEKLLATNSPASKFCRELMTGHRALTGVLRTTKAVPFQYFSQLLYILHEDSDKYVASHPRLMEFLKDRTMLLTDALKRKVRRTIGLLDEICQDENGKKAFYHSTNSQGVTKKDHIKNIEFTLFGVYVSKTNRGIQLSELAADLTSLRLYLREEYAVGLYAGNPCWKAGSVWITRTLESRKRRMEPADRSFSSSTTTANNRRNRVALSDFDESDDSDSHHHLPQRKRRHQLPPSQHHHQQQQQQQQQQRQQQQRQHQQQQQQQRTTVPASKRRRAPGNHVIITKQEEDVHITERGRPLAKRGGKKTGSFGRS